MPNRIRNWPNVAKYEIDPVKFPKSFKVMPKWQNFAKSGHTGSLVRVCVCEREVALHWKREGSFVCVRVCEGERVCCDNVSLNG